MGVESATTLIGGTTDLAWSYGETAYVVDLKRSHVSPESLQIQTYGLMAALSFGCRYYYAGVYNYTEETCSWSSQKNVFSDGASLCQLIMDTKAACENPELTRGTHCLDCYSRSQCPAHQVSKEEFETIDFRNYPESAEQAREQILSVQRLRDTADRIEGNVRAWASKESLYSEDGRKQYRKTIQSGRKSLDQARLKKEVPEVYERYLREGAPFSRWIWGVVKNGPRG